MQLSVTGISKDQWRSIVLNTLMSFVATFVMAWGLAGFSTKWSAIGAAASAGVMAALKVVEKLLTPTN